MNNESRKLNVMFGKSGGNAGKDCFTTRISLPKKWVDEIGITASDRGALVSFQDNKIIIEKCPEKKLEITDAEFIQAVKEEFEQVKKMKNDLRKNKKCEALMKKLDDKFTLFIIDDNTNTAACNLYTEISNIQWQLQQENSVKQDFIRDGEEYV